MMPSVVGIVIIQIIIIIIIIILIIIIDLCTIEVGQQCNSPSWCIVSSTGVL